MKRIAGFAGLLALCVGVAAAAERGMSVQVRQTQIRATPSFLGRIVASASYGDRLAVLASKGDWRQVAGPDGAPLGWMHGSALTPKRIVLKAGSRDAATAATSDEIALAGKGFNAQVEDAFKKQNKDVDFRPVDRMEKWVVSAREMETFLREGSVKLREPTP